MAKPAKQATFAKAVGVTQQDVSKLIAKGVLTRGGTLAQWIIEYTQNLRAQAAQWKSDDGIDRVKEAALLDRRKREELELKLEQMRKGLWPTAAIAQALDFHNSNVKTKMLGLPTALKSRCPELTPRQVDILDTLVREILADRIHDRLPPDIRRVVQQYYEELHATAEAQGEPVGGRVPLSKPRKQRRARKMANQPDAIPP